MASAAVNSAAGRAMSCRVKPQTIFLIDEDRKRAMLKRAPSGSFTRTRHGYVTGQRPWQDNSQRKPILPQIHRL